MESVPETIYSLIDKTREGGWRARKKDGPLLRWIHSFAQDAYSWEKRQWRHDVAGAWNWVDYLGEDVDDYDEEELLTCSPEFVECRDYSVRQVLYRTIETVGLSFAFAAVERKKTAAFLAKQVCDKNDSKSRYSIDFQGDLFGARLLVDALDEIDLADLLSFHKKMKFEIRRVDAKRTSVKESKGLCEAIRKDLLFDFGEHELKLEIAEFHKEIWVEVSTNDELEEHFGLHATEWKLPLAFEKLTESLRPKK